jgi:hypothetical protein
MNDPNRCPVCFFAMPRPFNAGTICPCCGTEFGYHDAAATAWEVRARWQALRESWARAGYPFRRPRHRPQGWDPIEQLQSGVLAQSSPASLEIRRPARSPRAGYSARYALA